MTELLLQTVINAVYAASYMSLIAVGLVMIFGVMRIINFAHGELYMAGAYSVVYLYAGAQLPFLLAVLAGLIFVGLLGLVMERALFRPLPTTIPASISRRPPQRPSASATSRSSRPPSARSTRAWPRATRLWWPKRSASRARR